MQGQKLKENIDKILRYWHTIEFLGQDNFPNRYEYIEKVKNYKRNVKQGKINNVKHLIQFSDITNTEIMQTVDKETKECKMTCWGNITVYVGKIKRETCIKALISRLGVKQDKRAEESFDRIALASFQVSPDGTYIDESLSLSPVLWAINQIESKDDDLAKKLDLGAYNSDNSSFELILAPKKSSQEPCYIYLEDINRLYEKLYDEYIKNVSRQQGEDVEKSFIIIYQSFSDQIAKERYEDDAYTGLSKDYYSRDINMLIHENMYGQLDETLQNYILALHNKHIDNEEISRIDVFRNDSPEKYELQLNRIMRMKNAPMGKWPSKYMPALMQQMAINLLIGKDIQEKFGENGKVFSVNGPPGTGKTTLLKEVVANNIVERAVLLAEYDCPDDAFSRENFENGTKAEYAYSDYVRHWYKLKNDRINDYNILVTSCNNAAVENISKELPVGQSILKDLNAENDTPKRIREQLNEIQIYSM